MSRFNRIVAESPKLTILIALLITAALANKARQFRFDSSVENLYDQNDPNKKYYEQDRARFGRRRHGCDRRRRR